MGHTFQQVDPLTGQVTRITYGNDGRIVVEEDFVAMRQLQRDNAEHRAAEAQRGWGDGRVFMRIPMNVYFGRQDINEARQNGDRDYIKKHLWNNRDYSQFRTREGKV